MATGKKIKVSISREEWNEFPKDMQERMALILKEAYKCDVQHLISDEDDINGWD